MILIAFFKVKNKPVDTSFFRDCQFNGYVSIIGCSIDNWGIEIESLCWLVSFIRFSQKVFYELKILKLSLYFSPVTLRFKNFFFLGYYAIIINSHSLQNTSQVL